MDFELDYVQMVFLDAEDLAEGGIGEAYESLLPKLREYVEEPVKIDELLDTETPRYSVRVCNTEFQIYGPELDEGEGQCWGRATHAFFAIVNQQLANCTIRFFAINAGNDLGGMFLTPAQAEASKRSVSRRVDWPYLPTGEHPWYGQYH